MRVCGATVPGLCPRLLDLGSSAAYLGVSPWTMRDLKGAETLKRVPVPVANVGDLLKLLFERKDLDRPVSLSKAQ
jgi:hypothetical protein